MALKNKSHFNLFFARGRCVLVGAKWKCQPGEFYDPINKHTGLCSIYIAPSGPVSLAGTQSALNEVQPSLLSSMGRPQLLCARIHQVLEDPAPLLRTW